ncbi:ABC transporter permease [Candidatus Babeliales bacterium]|nr:ABC transporter permease [Candidatus Babeliales bacterium]
MIKICFIGILIATCSLALVISIMNGFEQATYQKMQSIYPDLIINMQDHQNNQENIQKLLHDPKLNITHTALQKYHQALLCNPEIEHTPCMLVIHGIIPENESKVSNIATKIISPKESKLEELLHDNQILIGARVAESLDLCLDDEIFILCTKEESLHLSMDFSHHQAIITGIFKTGIEELDSSMLFCHQTFFDKLFPNHSIDQIHIKLKKLQHESITIQELKKSLKEDIYSWKDLYPTLLSALKLEKYAMFFILMLIVFVASMNIMSLISMYINQKKRDIAILLCFGMQQEAIKNIFLTMSIIISAVASSIGLSIAWLIGLALQKYPCIKLPDNVYDSDYLPIKLELSVFCAIFIITIFISMIACWYATAHVSKIKIVDTLKSS